MWFQEKKAQFENTETLHFFIYNHQKLNKLVQEQKERTTMILAYLMNLKEKFTWTLEKTRTRDMNFFFFLVCVHFCLSASFSCLCRSAPQFLWSMAYICMIEYMAPNTPMFFIIQVGSATQKRSDFSVQYQFQILRQRSN